MNETILPHTLRCQLKVQAPACVCKNNSCTTVKQTSISKVINIQCQCLVKVDNLIFNCANFQYWIKFTQSFVQTVLVYDQTISWKQLFTNWRTSRGCNFKTIHLQKQHYLWSVTFTENGFGLVVWFQYYNTPGTAGGPGGRDRTLAVKSLKKTKKIYFFS